jgi:soluble lytic murein transglycosylase-like protein|tara:strand:- start:550 stop:1125 length:576 start_codon:yes stop_codon:yes gene_type:complete
MSTNRLSFLLGVLTTSLAVMLFKEYQAKPEVIRTKTETIVRMVDVPRVSGNYDVQVEEIKSTLNKSKLKHILIYIEALCWEYGVDYEMVKAVIQTESSWNHKAVSTSGAIGLMQVLPSTAKSEFNTPKKDLFDPYVNVTVGIKYMAKLNQHFDDTDAMLTAYSHGPTITKKYSNNYISNNFYVKRVQDNLK